MLSPGRCQAVVQFRPFGGQTQSCLAPPGLLLLPIAFSLTVTFPSSSVTPKTLLKHVSRITVGGGECRFPPRWLCGSLTPVHSWQRQLAFWVRPDVRRAGRAARWRCRSCGRCRGRGKSASGSSRDPAPGDQVAKRDSGARRANSGRASAQPGSLPSPSGETRRALRARPSLAPVSPRLRPRLRPRPRPAAAAARTPGPQLPGGGGAVPAPPLPIPARSWGRARCGPRPKKGNGRPYSPRSFSRFAQGAHGRGRAPGAASPSAAGRARRGATHRHHRLPGPSAPASSPRTPDRGEPAGTNFV